MFEILTAGEDDGRKCNAVVADLQMQTDPVFNSVDSLLMKEDQLDEIMLKVEEAELEVERLKQENINNELRYKKDIERYKKDIVVHKDSKDDYIKQVAELTAQVNSLTRENKKLQTEVETATSDY